jgi:hypothetical protein
MIYLVRKYSLTCLTRAFLEPTFALAIDKFSVYTGYIYKDILHWNFINYVIIIILHTHFITQFVVCRVVGDLNTFTAQFRYLEVGNMM